MQLDEASNQQTNQATINEGGREQQNRHTLPPFKIMWTSRQIDHEVFLTA